MILQPRIDLLRPQLIPRPYKLRPQLLTPQSGLWALSFNGTSNYVILPQLFTSPTELTWGMWFKSDVADTTEQRLLAYNNDGIYIIISINAGTANLIRVFCYANSGGGWSSSTTAYDVTQWHLIVGTAKENDNLRLYVDGNEIGSPVSLTTFLSTGAGTARFIGSSRPTQSNWTDGQVDNAFIFSRVISAAEIRRLAENRQSQPDMRDLVGWWRFNEGYGTTTQIRDWSGQGNHGTMQNFTGDPWVNVGIR